jgi:GTPase SAR1 family protein
MPETIRISKKIMLLGDPAVGKTSMIRKFVYDVFDDKYITTLGMKVTTKQMIKTNDLRTSY